MLNNAVTAADAVRNNSHFDPWGAIGVGAGPVNIDLKSCHQKVLSQRKAMKSTRERWFSGETVASSAVGESAPKTTVRISDMVEVGDVHMWLSMKNSDSHVAVDQVPGRAKKGSHPQVLVSQKKQFSVGSPVVSRLSFESALEKSFEKSGARRSGRDRRNAPVFQGGYQ